MKKNVILLNLKLWLLSGCLAWSSVVRADETCSALSNNLSCLLTGDGNSCTQSKPSFTTGTPSFLEGLETLLTLPAGESETGLANAWIQSGYASVFGQPLTKAMNDMMVTVVADVMSGFGNPWGSSNPTISDIDDSASDPLQAMIDAAGSVYPIYRNRRGFDGRYQANNRCTGLASNISRQTGRLCSYIQLLKYAQLLTTSCSNDFQQGPSSTENRQASCGGSSDNSSSAEIMFNQAAYNGQSITRCSASVCGSNNTAMVQNFANQFWNGWADTCNAMRNLTTQNCSDLTSNLSNSLRNSSAGTQIVTACQCMKSYLSGNDISDDCKTITGCSFSQVNGRNRSNYNVGNACPNISTDASQAGINSYNNNHVNIETNALHDMSQISSCLVTTINLSNQVFMRQVYDVNNADNSSFGSMNTLIGPDNYRQASATTSTANRVMRLLTSDTLPSLSPSPTLLTGSRATLEQNLAQLYVTLLGGALASPSSLTLPSLPDAGGGASFLMNGRFLTVDNKGQVLGQSLSSSNTVSLVGGSGTVSQISQNQQEAKQSITAGQESYQANRRSNLQQKLMVLSQLYELFGQRAILFAVNGGNVRDGVTAQELRKTAATWRLDPSVKFNSSSRVFCDSGSDCKTWGGLIADMTMSELMAEGVQILSGIYGLQMEIYDQQTRLQLLSAIFGATSVTGASSQLNAQSQSVQQMALRYYEGLPDTSSSAVTGAATSAGSALSGANTP